MNVKLGIFAVPDASDPETTVEVMVTADRAGLDLVGVQDHPYRHPSTSHACTSCPPEDEMTPVGVK